MDTELRVDVAALDVAHRRALEEVIGCALGSNEQLVINVVSAPRLEDDRPAQTLEDWTSIYDGLSEEQIEEIDRIAKTRANLTRDLP
jgi:hypothetical protein